MALERPLSPPNSDGRDSPVPRPPRRQGEEEPRKHDKSYRRYAAGIERAIALFDTAHLEWPDYISGLGRLLKASAQAVQAHPQALDTLPHRTAVANRLSQCLNPSLPSGVHQKAIEVYSYIFSLIGKDALAYELQTYLPGLSSVLSFASLSLRPYFLSLVETYILVLDGVALRPALKALILCLLPGLEEETSEDFDRTLNIVDTLKDAVNTGFRNGDDDTGTHGFGDEYFWQCFFLACISSRSRRQGALAFLVRRLPKLGPKPDANADSAVDQQALHDLEDLPLAAESVVSPEPGLLIRCFAAGLGDEQILLQRGFLDLLLTHLPLNSPVLTRRVPSADLELLVTAAVGVVTRRDMSLNRRLWSWLLGPELTSTENETSPQFSPSNDVKPSLKVQDLAASTYFGQFGIQPLAKSVLSMTDRSVFQPSFRAKPFRICVSLMDRWEVGSLLIPQVFLPLMENLMTYKSGATDDDFQEALRSARSFFDGIESGLIWGQILKLLAHSLGRGPMEISKRLHNIDLAKFIISYFNVREEEMLLVHIPLISVCSMALLDKRESDDSDKFPHCSEELLGKALHLVEILVLSMPARSDLNNSLVEVSAERISYTEALGEESIIKKIQHFYLEQYGNSTTSPSPFSPPAIADLLLRESATLALQGLRPGSNSTSIIIRSKILSSLIVRFPLYKSLNFADIISAFQDALSRPASSRDKVTFSTLIGITQILVHLLPASGSANLASTDISNLIIALVGRAWFFLTPSYPKYHVEAVRCLWQLDELTAEDRVVEDRVVEAAVTSFIAGRQRDANDQLESANRFTVLWTHTTQLQDANAKRKQSVQSKRESTVSEVVGQSEIKDYRSTLQRPLLLLLEKMGGEETELQCFMANWIESLPDVGSIFDFLLAKIVAIQASWPERQLGEANREDAKAQLSNQDESCECLYYLQHLATMLKLCSRHMWLILVSQLNAKGNQENHISESKSLQDSIAHLCLQLLRDQSTSTTTRQNIHTSVRRTAISILRSLLESPDPSTLRRLALEEELIDIIRDLMAKPNKEPSIQIALLNAITSALKLKSLPTPSKSSPVTLRLSSSLDTLKVISGMSTTADGEATSRHSPPPPQLVKCLQEGIASSSANPVLDNWIHFLVEVLPLFADAIFQNLIPLVECLCREIRKSFQQLHATFSNAVAEAAITPEPALISLLTGLEHILATGYDRLVVGEHKNVAIKSPEQPQSFFGNVVSGVFPSEVQKDRGSMANTRLTVLLCFQDAVRICLSIWSWDSYEKDPNNQDSSCSASFTYVSVRLRNKARRILDRMFTAEALECLETLIVTWARQGAFNKSSSSLSVMNLLQVLDGARPKNTMPAVFNAIYSRNNPTAIDTSRASTLTSDITDVELGQFLVEYTKSLDDDAMDEIWTDCITFLRDVLTNPIPHHQILPSLLVFLVILAEKVDNTNFGEQRKMRKELSDLFMRILAAVFATKSSGNLQEPVHALVDGERRSTGQDAKTRYLSSGARTTDLVDILSSILPRLQSILPESDRLASAASNISTHMISPTLHSKKFPTNVKLSMLDLLYKLSKIPQASKTWKKDVFDAFNNPKFFSSPLALVDLGWLPILRQWALNDKERITELFSRIVAPTSAGIMFGVGAGAARLESDRKTQLALRRVALLTIASADDFIVMHLGALEEKITELFGATVASSPSSVTRAEAFMVIRALILKTTSIHLAPLWPVISSELQKAIYSALPGSKEYDTYNALSLLQACKLLDLLLVVAPEDFQMHEWLFITDTIDAVYRPGHWEPIGLVDEIAEELSTVGPLSSPNPLTPNSEMYSWKVGNRKSLLLDVKDEVADTSKGEFVSKILRPFFAQLSIHAFEATYSMAAPDWKACEEMLLKDLFDDRTIIG